MAIDPNITLTVTISDFRGIAVPNSAIVIKLRGYGQTIPKVAGQTMIAEVTERIVLPDGTSAGIELFGNDQIEPLNFDGTPKTFYVISLQDAQRRVIQSGVYQLTGTGTFDMSDLDQIFGLPSYPYFVDNEKPQSFGSVLQLDSAPNPAASLELYRNGQLQPPGEDFSLAGNLVTLFIPPQQDDVFSAFYRSRSVSNTGSSPFTFIDDAAITPAIDGVNKNFYLPSAPSPLASLRFFYNGSLFTSGTDYTLNGNEITYLNFAPQEGDTHEAFYRS